MAQYNRMASKKATEWHSTVLIEISTVQQNGIQGNKATAKEKPIKKENIETHTHTPIHNRIGYFQKI